MIDAGNTAWVLMSAALVMLMTPALGFFYGGLVNRKNVLSTIMHSFFILALISVVWVLWGYSLVFDGDHGGVIGGLGHIGLKGISPTDVMDAYGIPVYAFIAFQMMFAAITPALITARSPNASGSRPSSSSAFSGPPSSTRRSPTGSGAVGGWPNSARSTSRAEP